MKKDDTANAIGGFLALLLLPIILILALFGAFGPETTSNFARQGYGGKWRRVSKSEVDDYVAPLDRLYERVDELTKKAGKRVSAEGAEELIEESAAIADEIEAVCAKFEEQNFSFAHKRTSDRYNAMIASGRKNADIVREMIVFRGADGKTVEPDDIAELLA